MSNINLFGGTGFIGKKFHDLYKNEVILNERNNYTPQTNNILYFISTVDNYNIHQDLQIDIDTNLKVLMNVLEHIKYNKNAVFNFVSSWFVYGQNPDIPFHEENSKCNPTGFYSITKFCAEQMIICFCNTFDIKYRIFRLANVLGEGDNKISAKKNALQFMVKEIVNNKDIHLYYGGEVLRDYIYIDDVCDGIKVCLDKAPTNQIINIGSGSPSRFLNIIDKTIKKTNSTSQIINIEPTKFHNIVQVRHSYLDTAKIRSYGFEPKYNMDNILDKLIQHYKA